jgi:hypothetical protein
MRRFTESTQESCGDQRGLPRLDTLFQDIRFGARMRRQNNGFSVVSFRQQGLRFGAKLPIAVDQRLKSVFRRARITSSKSDGRMPNRPVRTRVLSVQSLSVRTTEEALRLVRLQDGCVGSTATPKHGNLAAGSVVMKATTKSPGNSAVARTTHGRRFVPDKSVNGNAARTISPTCGMFAEIGIFVAGFDVGVGIKVRLRREKVEGATLLRESSHRRARKVIVAGLRHDEHELGRGAWPSFQWNSYDTGSVYLDRQRFHVPNITYRGTLPSFYVPLWAHSSIRWWRFVMNEDFL